MKNIEYLEHFFRKHNLSGKIKVKYNYPVEDDEYMTDITFENGDVINIHDVIFDIESELPEDLFEKWMEVKKEKDISFSDWMQTDIHYVPKDMDTSSVEEYQKEMTEIMEKIKNGIDTMFQMGENLDIGDSDLDDEDDEGEDE